MPLQILLIRSRLQMASIVHFFPETPLKKKQSFQKFFPWLKKFWKCPVSVDGWSWSRRFWKALTLWDTEQNYACLKLFTAEETDNYACLILLIAEEFHEFQDGRQVVFSFSTLNLACGP